MIFELVSDWLELYPGFGLLRYTTFRAAMAVFTAFVLSLLLGRVLIRRFTATGIAEDTTKTDSDILRHLHEGKHGTPTMGGLFLVAGMAVSAALWMRFDGPHAFSTWGILLILWYAAVGFVDDWIKLNVEGKLGMSKKAKQLLLTVGAVAIAVLLQHHSGLEAEQGGPRLYFPLLKDYSLDLSLWAGVPFVVVCVLVLSGSANAVNFTDGLDGLATGCVAIAALAYVIIAYLVGHQALAEYLLIEHVPGCSEMCVLLAALLGACLAFLWYNAAPAQVFMGDVGSLALGGALGYVALVSRTELVLLVVGGVFVAEALSVIIQVISFRTTGKRVFRCAPLHHHFQFGGMPETRLVIRTWIVGLLLALSSLALFKIR